MNHIYCISGLGADKRIFQKLTLRGSELHFIEWELPEPGDTMRTYALKLARQIKHPSIVLIGVSFGGMLASEIGRYFAELKKGMVTTPDPLLNQQQIIENIILISSCKSPVEFPSLMRLAAAIKIHKAVPYRFILNNKTLNRFVFDLRSNEEELYLKRMMLQENNLVLIKRSINIIFSWKANLPADIIHIHGSADRLLTPGKVKADYWISDGGHFMVWNKAAEISAIINQLLPGDTK
jgi:pimeloyl-ACP methyl ester carboxylesterase